MRASKEKLRLGWISYLNLHPFLQEIKLGCESSFEFSYGTPAEINQRLRLEQVDLAPSSSICLLKDTPVDTLPVGVVSAGEVLSVYLGFQKEHENFFLDFTQGLKHLSSFIKEKKEANLQTLAHEILNFSKLSGGKSLIPQVSLTKESQTSVQLSKILFSSLYGEACLEDIFKDTSSVKKPVELLIGDRAIQRKGEFYKILDLGSVWWDLTGFPFVYAVFQSRIKIEESLKGSLLAYARRAQKTMHVSPEVYFDSLPDSFREIDKDFIAKYWTSLFYEVDDRAKKGLDLFLALSKEGLAV